MFASLSHPRARRRGVVLILVLGMLALLALMGVTFATFSGQARVNARNFSQAQSGLDLSEVMDYALAQLIEDTANPQSALRGHSLMRDMYGNDAGNNGYLASEFLSGTPLHLTAAPVQKVASGNTPATATINGRSVNVTGLYQVVTNIPVNSSPYYGYDFTRWIMTFSMNNPVLGDHSTDTSPYYVATTYEVLFDDNSGAVNSNYHVFYVADAPTPAATPTTWPPTVQNYTSPVTTTTSVNYGASTLISLATAYNGTTLLSTSANQTFPFTLDGRFLRAFNGPGMGNLLGAWGNFRVNGGLLSGYNTSQANPAYGSYDITVGLSAGGALGVPDAIGMDEDYDAVDLDNWFLAMQSADGHVIIPSFHRPGIIRADPTASTYSTSGYSNQIFPVGGTQPSGTVALVNDWRSTSADSAARFLRPRSVDGHSPVSFPDLYPDNNGKVQYDVDNDGDGVTDSVWLDLGYSVTTDPNGNLYKPLFAFLVVGLNGRMPLNTAGNLQQRDATGAALGLPASHLGISPSEIDPIYGLQAPNSPNFSHIDNAYGAGGGVPVNVTQVRNILAGTVPQPYPLTSMGVTPTNTDMNLVPFGLDLLGNPQSYYLPNNIADAGDFGPPATATTTTHSQLIRYGTPVTGRWGESQYIPNGSIFPLMEYFNNPVRAGESNVYSPSSSPTMAFNYNPPYPNFYRDADDDNYTTYDPYPAGTGEYNDYRDAAGGWPLPVERIRRYTSPIDTGADGTVITFGQAPPTNTIPQAADAWGRVTYFKYARPPGLPNVALNTYPTIPDVTTNPLHGFDSARNPNYAIGAPTPTTLLAAAMPYDMPYTGNQPNYTSPPSSATVGVPPTMDLAVNSFAAYNSPSATPYTVPSMNEADEMRLYQLTPLDDAFGPSDLEWLYRLQDIDGASLQSRLAYLAPISFTNIVDGLRRRRLYSVDTWDTTNFVWAYDNPGNAYTYLGPPLSSNASFLNVGYTTGSGYPSSYVYNLNNVINNSAITDKSDWIFDNASLSSKFNIAYNYASNTSAPAASYALPSLAHRDRKINLNYPLPVSTDPDEPIRQKWILESYQLMKQVLPPASVDTPLELAQLSQYLTNVIDFRDTDATMTHFVNPDVVLQLPTASAAGSAMQPVFAGASGTVYPLDQFGMEYNPVALNEVLAYSFYRFGTSGGSGTQTNRFFVELVNTLTQSADPLDNASTAGNVAGASKLDLGNWDMVILPDTTAQNRPDPTTGNLPIDPTTSTATQTNQVDPKNCASSTIKAYGPIPLGASPHATPAIPAGSNVFDPGITPASDVILWPLQSTTSPFLSPAAGSSTAQGKNYFYVIGNSIADTTVESFPPSIANTGSLTTPQLIQTILNTYDPFTSGTLPKVNPLPQIAASQGLYYWLCLRRPANPFLPAGATLPNGTTNPMVVVDCMRFPYIEASGPTSISEVYTGMPATFAGYNYAPGSTPSGADNPAPKNFLYSAQRIQPYRGGHAAAVQGSTPAQIDTTYGYSEQMAVPVTKSQNTYGVFKGSKLTGSSPSTLPSTPYQVAITQPIYHTLGAKNDPQSGTPENWDLFPFHDRDFTSVIELTLVPGCPPGLFTKQFVEICPSSSTTNTFPISTPSAPGATPPLTALPASPATAGAALGTNATLTFPYLVDNFYYSSPAKAFLITSAVSDYNQGSTAATLQADGANPNGFDTAGWYKMFEFFEVPSTALGAVAEVSNGINYDWARQDTRPGQLNINLIIDEEVFLGLMGNAGLATDLATYSSQYANANNPAGYAFGGATPPALDGYQMAVAALPKVVTMVNPNTGGMSTYPVSNAGFFSPLPTSVGGSGAGIKAAFGDFLKIRHGGSGNLFAWGNGAVGQTNASERPFRSLSFPDIDYTVMRPAFLPPSSSTSSWKQNSAATPLPVAAAPVSGSYLVWDPGVRNPFLMDQSSTVANPLPPVTPVRRLFQRPDDASGRGNHDSNADYNADPFVNDVSFSSSLYKNYFDLTSGDDVNATPIYGNTTNTDYNLQGNTKHPYFRTEWLQKVTNLTTVRTHQYAVWITVGFFEVVKQGDPILADTLPSAAADILGEEVGLLNGSSKRYRSFFIVDRTKAVGFNPQQPGNFRSCVTYRQVIE